MQRICDTPLFGPTLGYCMWDTAQPVPKWMNAHTPSVAQSSLWPHRSVLCLLKYKSILYIYKLPSSLTLQEQQCRTNLSSEEDSPKTLKSLLWNTIWDQSSSQQKKKYNRSETLLLQYRHIQYLAFTVQLFAGQLHWNEQDMRQNYLSDLWKFLTSHFTLSTSHL